MENEDLIAHEFPLPDQSPINISLPLSNPTNPSFPDYLKQMLCNLSLLIYSIAKITVCFLIYFKGENFCSEPLDIWLCMVIFNEGIIVLYLVLALILNHGIYTHKYNEAFIENHPDFTSPNNYFNPEEISFLSTGLESSNLMQFLNNLDNYNFILRLNHRAEQHFLFLTYLRQTSHFFYLILFLWGCFLLTMRHSTCPLTAPYLHSICLVLVLLGLLYVFLPLFLLICICFCIPCLLISSLFCGKRGPKSIERDLVKKLERKAFNTKDYAEDEECVICRSYFVKKERIIVLPCNKKHYFHESCGEKWLNISCFCPICRADLNEKMKEGSKRYLSSENKALNHIIQMLDDEK